MKKFKITIAGGGSTYTPGIIKALMINLSKFPIGSIRLYDIDEQRQKDISLIAEKVIEEFDSSIEFIVTINPKIAFQDSDFVFAQIRVGKYEMRDKDEKIPLSFGLVGQETCGAGGMAYGLRTISGMIDICDYTAQYGNDAWIINYSNPAAVVAEAIRRLRPDAKILNICDMPIGMMLRMCDILGCEGDEMEINYFGLNHFGWFTNVYVNGIERINDLRKYMSEHGLVTPQQTKDVQHNDVDWIKTHTNIKYLLEYFPEYLPNSYLQYYLMPHKVVSQSNPTYTRSDRVRDHREKELFDSISYLKETGNFEEGFKIGVHGTFIVDVAMSLAFNEKRRMIVIVENKGAIPNLPDDAMVEIPAYLTSRGPESISIKPIPLFYKGLIEQQLCCEKLLVEAYISKSYSTLLQAFSLNKTIPSMEVAKEVLDALIEANKDYWPTFE